MEMARGSASRIEGKQASPHSVRSPLRLEEMRGVGYVNREHEKRTSPTARIVEPDSAPDPGGAVVSGRGLRAAHYRPGGAGGGAARRAPGAESPARAEFAELLAATLVRWATRQAQATESPVGA